MNYSVCLLKTSKNVREQLRSYARRYEGAPDAYERAANDLLSDLVDERADIVDQILRKSQPVKAEAPPAPAVAATPEKPAEFTAETDTAPDAAPAADEAWKEQKGAARLQALVAKTKDVAPDAYEDARLPGYMGEAVDAMAALFKKDVVVFRAKPGTAYAPGGLLFPADPSTIYLNADANVAPAVVFMHEMVHSMKRTDPKTYATLEKAVGKLLKNKKEYVQKRLRGKTLPEDLVTEEMIADVMADHASNPQFWSDLYGRFDNKSAWNKLVDYVRSLMSNVIDTLYPIGANNYISDFNAAYQAVVDAAYNHARAQHGDVASNVDAPLEMFAGQSAKGANAEALSTAKQMEKDGAKSADIWEQTGWHRGKDRKWRFEIADKDAKWKMDFAEMEESKLFATPAKVKLSDLLDHPALYAAYPAAADIQVVKRKGLFDFGGLQGWFDGKNDIGLTPYAQHPLSTLLHEVQHWIQSQEGFAQGGNESSVYDTLSTEQKTELAEKLLKAQTLKAEKAAKDLEGARKLFEKYGDQRAEISDGPYEARMDFKDDARAMGVSDAVINAFLFGTRTEAEIARSAEYDIADAGKKIAAIKSGDEKEIARMLAASGEMYTFYKALAGEVEARNTQKRQDMTLEERLRSSPENTEDVDRGTQIVIMEDDVASSDAPLESAMLSSTQGSPPSTDASRALSALRGTDPSLYGRAKKLWKQGFFPGGLLRGDVAKRNFERQAKIAGISYEAGNAVGNLERAVKDAYGKEFSKLSEADMRDIQAALTGKVPENMPAQVEQAVVAMRQMIDRQSRDYIQILREQIAVKMANDQDVANDKRLLNTITNNLESYAFRSYKAFDDPNWWKTVKKDVVERAVNFIADGYMAQGITQAEAVTRANQRVAEFKTGSAADSMESFIKESKLGGKDLSVLMRRKDIPIPIRDLLGEYVDPRVNFTKSIAKMGRLVQNQRFLESVRDMGMGSLLWEKDDLSRPAEARTPVAAEGADTYSPLSGLMTTEEFAEALKDATAKAQIEGWYKWVVGANAMVNYGKTVLSPTTQVRNFLSAALFTAANGHFNYARLADATNAVKARFAGPHKRAAAQAYIKDLIDRGVLHDNAAAGDFQTYLQSSGIERLFDPDTVVGKVNSGVKSLYQFSDDFWKIVGYENELAAQKRAGLSDEAAKQEAAERIRNTYPTYSMAGKAIKALARSPVAGAFPTFSAEIVRNTYHIIRYAKHDIQEGIRTGNKAQTLNGARRVAGIALMASAVYILQAYSANSIGLDDDEEEALRQLMPSWQQNSNMFWLKRDEYGRPTYMDMSWMDVYGIWKRPINAIMRDQPLDDAFKQGAIEFLSPFLGADIMIQAVVEAGMNKKFGTGAPVYYEATKVEDIANHIRKAVQPGIAGNAERIYRAAEGQTKPGGVGEYSLGEEALAFAGLRVSSVDPALGLRSKGYDFAKATQESGQGLRRTLSSPNDVSEAEIDDQMETAIRLHNEANARTRRTVEAAMKAGLSANQALRILDGSGISKKRAQALVQGRSMPFELSDRAMKDALDRAASIPGRKDNRAEIKKRYNYAERKLKELQRGQ